MMPLFRKLLVANRGEIACRVIRSAQEKGYRTVAVFSDADANARHVNLADEAIRIGEGPVGRSYLDLAAIMTAAKATGADAIHPGYGFLSERAALADACAEAGIIFVGPSAEAIRVMGDKAASKRRMIAAGVPCVPGYEGDDQSDVLFESEAQRVGFPVMVKATAGGGGRGMRLVDRAEDLLAALRSARSEAMSAFGDDRLLLERAIVEPRHVEIQVMGDTYGQVIHLGERDCSVQRRHQKVIEEAPSPAVDASLRQKMGDAAVAAAMAVNYVGAGTVEFLLGADKQFYFLEMNTRLQVEHPVTEMVTGLDLVAMQLDVAAGKPLPLAQDQVNFTGHAIEARLYAEDPQEGFLPQTGQILGWEPAAGKGVRIDHGLTADTLISPYYDPMLAKIIAHGDDREEARRRLVRAIEDSVILGVATNKAFLVATLETGEFAQGAATTGFIGRHFPDGYRAPAPSFEALAIATALLVGGEPSKAMRSSLWRSHPLHLMSGEKSFRVAVESVGDGLRISLTDNETILTIASLTSDRIVCRIGDRVHSARFAIDGAELHLDWGGRLFRFEDMTYASVASSASAATGALRAPMSGLIVAVDVAVGDRVMRGQSLAVLEAMKMEHRIVALAGGMVESVAIRVGLQVASRDVLIIIQPEKTA